jgi:putative DNA primase/helicase
MSDAPPGMEDHLKELNKVIELKRETGETYLHVQSGADIKPEPISWIWKGWIAKGKLHILAGAPGTGKTTIALALAATITCGGRFPDFTPADAGDVLIWSGEDDPKDTLVPRLIACGADVSRVHFIHGVNDFDGRRSFDPAYDIQLLRDKILEMRVPIKLVIIDPIVSAVAGDSHKNAEVRRDLQGIVDLAQHRNCAVVGISHFSKGTAGQNPIERVTGSLAFGALSRVVFAAAKLEENGVGGRIFKRAKSNIGPDSGGFHYKLKQVELDDHPGVFTSQLLWGDAVDGTARELLEMAEDNGRTSNALDDAIEFLKVELCNGPVSSKEMIKRANDAGHSIATIRRAKHKLGIESVKDSYQGEWLWSLTKNAHPIT